MSSSTSCSSDEEAEKPKAKKRRVEPPRLSDDLQLGARVLLCGLDEHEFEGVVLGFNTMADNKAAPYRLLVRVGWLPEPGEEEVKSRSKRRISHSRHEPDQGVLIDGVVHSEYFDVVPGQVVADQRFVPPTLRRFQCGDEVVVFLNEEARWRVARVIEMHDDVEGQQVMTVKVIFPVRYKGKMSNPYCAGLRVLVTSVQNKVRFVKLQDAGVEPRAVLQLQPPRVKRGAGKGPMVKPPPVAADEAAAEVAAEAAASDEAHTDHEDADTDHEDAAEASDDSLF